MLATDGENMGNSAAKNEVESKEQKKSNFRKLLTRFQLCPNKPEKWSSKKVKKEEGPPPKPPLRNQTERMEPKGPEAKQGQQGSDWVDVALQVPESQSKSKKDSKSQEKPIPPPRKHKSPLQGLFEFQKKSNRTPNENMSNLSMVEEPIIVPKKVIEHVCDGKHHHVHNVVNGKVVDQIVDHSSFKQNRSQLLSKNPSSLSLLTYDDMKKKEEKRNKSPTKSKNKSSASSLPNEKKSISSSAAEVIESCMTRCKSFGSILPNQKVVKPSNLDLHTDKDSVDSWSGLDDWDMGIIENDVSDLTPKNITSGQRKNMAIDDFDQMLNSNAQPVDSKQTIKAIDDEHLGGKTSPKLSLPNKRYPFNKLPSRNTFENDVYMTTQFLKNESMMSGPAVKNDIYKKDSTVSNNEINTDTKLAPLATFDSDRDVHILLNTGNNDLQKRDSNVDKRVGEIIAQTNQEPKLSVTVVRRNVDSKLPGDNTSAPTVNPRRKSKIGHSNLLKFITETSDEIKSPSTVSNHHLDSASAFVPLMDSVPQNKDAAGEEPKIIPEIRNLEASWQQLVQRDKADYLASLLELETSISDNLDASSDGTRSTIVDSVPKGSCPT